MNLNESGPRAFVLVPGVGIGGWSFDSLAELLEDRGRVVVHDRLAGRPFELQVDHLQATVEACGSAVVVGVSGGATLGLALAIRRPAELAGAVLHEPLVGPLVAELHAVVSELRDRLSTEESYGAMAFVSELVGVGTWNRLPPAERTALAQMDAVVEADAAAFGSFAPTPESLQSVRGLPMVASHGRRSGPVRAKVTQLLGSQCGAEEMTVAGCGHLAQLDNPEGLLAAVRSLVRGEAA